MKILESFVAGIVRENTATDLIEDMMAVQVPKLACLNSRTCSQGRSGTISMARGIIGRKQRDRVLNAIVI